MNRDCATCRHILVNEFDFPCSDCTVWWGRGDDNWEPKEAKQIDITGAKRIMRYVAQGAEAAGVLLKEFARLEAKVAYYERQATCHMCRFVHVKPDISPCNGCDCNNYQPWEPDVAETAKEVTDDARTD